MSCPAPVVSDVTPVIHTSSSDESLSDSASRRFFSSLRCTGSVTTEEGARTLASR